MAELRPPRTRMIARRSASTRVTTCGGASILCRKWRRRASRMGGVRPWLDAGAGGGCAPFGATMTTCDRQTMHFWDSIF